MRAWRDHAQNSARVASKIPDVLHLIQNDSEISSIAHLITHVFGEHLGNWQGGLALLEKLSTHQKINDDGRAAVARGIAALRLAERDGISIDSFSKSDQVRILCVAAAARVAHAQVESATEMLSSAMALSAEL